MLMPMQMHMQYQANACANAYAKKLLYAKIVPVYSGVGAAMAPPPEHTSLC